MADDSLCCVINPVNDCWKCSTKLCKAHSNFSVENLYWCEACYSLDEDSFMMMTRYQERIEDAATGFDDLKTELETVGDHPSRCKICKAEEYCEALMSLIDNVDYNIRKKWNNKTF